jgi:hypothetical protein
MPLQGLGISNLLFVNAICKYSFCLHSLIHQTATLMIFLMTLEKYGGKISQVKCLHKILFEYRRRRHEFILCNGTRRNFVHIFLQS